MAQTPEKGQGLGRFLSCGARKPELTYIITSIKISFGPNFGKLHTAGSNRVWCYFLVHIFKIKKVRIDFIAPFQRYCKVVKNFIQLYLRKIGLKFWRNRFRVYNYLFSSCNVEKTVGRTLAKKICFCFLITNICTCPYLSRIFLILHPPYEQS